MTTLYSVQCNVRQPEVEAEWNAWYDGSKTSHMMAKPHFLRSQRFRARAFDTDVAYLALWELRSPAALTTPEYLATWGWDRWASLIDDWVRDLSIPDDPLDRVPFIDGGVGAVHAHLAWFDRGHAEVRPALDAAGLDTAAWWWGTCEGLDQSANSVALRLHPSQADAPITRVFDGVALKETVYQSISPVAHAAPSDAVLSS
jgi:hypothetical protein